MNVVNVNMYRGIFQIAKPFFGAWCLRVLEGVERRFLYQKNYKLIRMKNFILSAHEIH